MRRAVVLLASTIFAATAQAQVSEYFTSSVVEGAWSDPAKPGQGLFIDSDAERKLLFVGWFTFESGESGAQRWLTAQLKVEGALATGPIFATRGGRLDTPPDARQQTVEVGSMSIDFLDCANARVTYAITEPGRNETGRFDARPLDALTDPTFSCDTRTKLRLPQAAPGISDEAYAEIANDLFIPNNFGQFQHSGPSAPFDVYMHDGLDIALPNGTPIHALESGTVRDVRWLSTSSGGVVTVESDARPGEGWSYVHVNPTNVAVIAGAHIEAGTVVGVVQFTGVEHLHLTRAALIPGRTVWWAENLATVNPTGWFDIPDDEAPIIEPDLWFLQQGSMEALPRGAVLSGNIDIIAGIRDLGEHARTLLGGSFLFGNRQAIAWVEYVIEGQGRFLRQRAFDLAAITIDRPTASIFSMGPWARVIYFPPSYLESTPSNNLSYYLLTNGDGGPRIDLDDANRAWRTTEFPNGSYQVTVRAADFAGNVSAITNTVEVNNG